MEINSLVCKANYVNYFKFSVAHFVQGPKLRFLSFSNDHSKAIGLHFCPKRFTEKYLSFCWLWTLDASELNNISPRLRFIHGNKRDIVHPWRVNHCRNVPPVRGVRNPLLRHLLTQSRFEYTTCLFVQ